MTESDPYRVLGVARSATRAEIAVAYRRLAKQHHPDAGAPPSVTMARINEAWHVLSDAGRRTSWDRAHSLEAPPHWRAPTAEPMRRPTPAPAAPVSRMDSGWAATGVVAVAVTLVGLVMLGISAVAAPPDDRLRFTGEHVTFAYPSDWTLAAGDGTDAEGHRVIAHLVTFGVEPEQLCTSFAAECELTGDDVPHGHASVLMTAWSEGSPPVPDPLVSRPYGLDADAMIGGKPAAVDVRRVDADSVIAWWQLSPPGFPDRWIEVRADIRGQDVEEAEMLSAIGFVLDSLEFTR